MIEGKFVLVKLIIILMAGSIYTLDKFIKKSFGIQVAARSSSDVDEICRKNGLSFCELLQPFSQAVSECRFIIRLFWCLCM